MSMPVVGYTDSLTVQPGHTVQFKISSEAPAYSASLVRLVRGDTNADGPGLKVQRISSTFDGVHPGGRQSISAGSFVRIPHRTGLTPPDGFTVHLWMWSTAPDCGTQTLLSQGSVGQGGYALRIEDGRIAAHVGDRVAMVFHPVVPRRWYSVAMVVDAVAGEVRLDVVPTGINRAPEHHHAHATVVVVRPGGSDILIGAERLEGGGAGHFFNGKIDAPRMHGTALSESAVEQFRRSGSIDPRSSPMAAWDFSLDVSNWTVTDTVGEFHGYTVNKPMRGATGHNWDGTETSWAHAPAQYGAIHFHDDDLADAGWTTSFDFTVPDDLPSAVYAAHLSAGEAEDYVPLVVRPRSGRPTSAIALILPTFSYLVHAHGQSPDGSLPPAHSDGSAVCHSSRLRPIINMRPQYAAPRDHGRGSPHQFTADLHIVDWLHESGYEVDLYTDEDLHREGCALLEPYTVVLTGSHPEYWSAEMLDGAQSYLSRGGRVMALCGNGMHGVVQLDPETGTSVEIRHCASAVRMWDPEPGEAHLSSTGELGGSWRFRGRGPHSWVGAGHVGVTTGAGQPYRRTACSYDAAVSFVFDGVEGDLVGGLPRLVNPYGASGFEVGRADRALGSPVETVVLATAEDFGNQVGHGGASGRADMTLLFYPSGGAVFSVGSSAWSGYLSHNGYENDASRITRNVLDRFVSDRIQRD